MKRKNERGQVLVSTALALVVLMGFAGLAIDTGVLRYDKRLQQTAADAAAIAGADELRYCPVDGRGMGACLNRVTAAGRNASGSNSFTGLVDDAGVSLTCTDASAIGCVSVIVNNPPLTGPHSGNVNYVEALITVLQPTFFMRALGKDRAVVLARAVATSVGQSGTAPGCIYTLGHSGPGFEGVFTGGTPTVHAETCGVFDNGEFKASGTVDIDAAAIGVAEGTPDINGGAHVSPTPTPGMAPITDPLSFLQPPPVGAPVTFNPAVTPVPGTTYDGMKINSGDVVNFPAGTYVIDGDLTINAGATVCNQVGAGCSSAGTSNGGVTFYVTNRTRSNKGSVTIDGGANVYLAAPNEGDYAGILFYQDPHDTLAAKVEGNSASYYQGGLYFPKAQLTFGGTSLTNTKADYTIIVCDTLKIDGTADLFIKSNYTSLPGAVSIIEHAILVE